VLIQALGKLLELLWCLLHSLLVPDHHPRDITIISENGFR